MQDLLAEFLRHLALEKHASALTVKSYREDLTQALEYFTGQLAGAKLSPERLTTRLVRAYLAWLSTEGYARTTIARRLAAVRSWCRFLCVRGAIDRNPADGLRGPRLEKRLPHFLPTQDVSKLVAAPIATPLGCRDRAMLEALYSAGLRVSELVGLNLDDLDLDDGLVTVRGKGKRERLALLGDPARKAIRGWLEERATLLNGREDAALFLNRFGRRLTTRSVARLLEKYIAQTGIDRRSSPHTLRHSFATHLLESGVDLFTLKALMGHESLGTTARYLHVSRRLLERAPSLLDLIALPPARSTGKGGS
jgi:integrase/recombinase XerC